MAPGILTLRGGIMVAMPMTWRPPDDLAEDTRRAAFELRKSANQILNEAVRDWLDTRRAAGHTDPRPEGRPDAPVPVR